MIIYPRIRHNNESLKSKKEEEFKENLNMTHSSKIEACIIFYKKLIDKLIMIYISSKI